MLGSIPRFDLVIFPLFIVLALIGARSRAFHLGYVVASSMLAALFNGDVFPVELGCVARTPARNF